MSISGVDIFPLVINYLDEGWITQHAIVGLFEIEETNGNRFCNSKVRWKNLE
jgi:hypothetical protein